MPLSWSGMVGRAFSCSRTALRRPLRLPIPMAMAVGSVHEALVAAGLRTLCGIAAEAGDCRDIHHAAVLIGYGAGAVCPWLALETALSLAPAGTDPAESEKKMLKALDAGLAKVMSKMGISVVDSYRSAHLFDILGLARDGGGSVLRQHAGAAVGDRLCGTRAPASRDVGCTGGWRGGGRDWGGRPARLWLGALPQDRPRLSLMRGSRAR